MQSRLAMKILVHTPSFKQLFYFFFFFPVTDAQSPPYFSHCHVLPSHEIQAIVELILFC